MKQSWVDSVDSSQRGWVRPCTWASRGDSYCASVSHCGKGTQLRGTLWLTGVIVMVICHLAHLRKTLDYSIPHIFAQLSVLSTRQTDTQEGLIQWYVCEYPLWIFILFMWSLWKDHLGSFQWWLFSSTILSTDKENHIKNRFKGCSIIPGGDTGKIRQVFIL